jgi:hypothetical protein
MQRKERGNSYRIYLARYELIRMNGTLRAFVTTIKGKIRQIIISGVIRHPNGTIITIFMLQTKGQNVSWLAIVSILYFSGVRLLNTGMADQQQEFSSQV